jgi:DNA-binding IclR family transcriptional regulator
VAANGKVFMAFGGSAAGRDRPARALHRRRRDRAALERQSSSRWRLGYAGVDELELGLAAMAAPVRGPGGGTAALDLGPDQPPHPGRIERLAPLDRPSRPAQRQLGYEDYERGAA